MKKILRKPALVICASALIIAGAAVSFASYKERSSIKTKEVTTVSPVVETTVESIEPVGNKDQVQSVSKPVNRTMTYEQQAEMIEEQTRLRNEAHQQIEQQ